MQINKSKEDVVGDLILKRVFLRDVNQGGVFLEATGLQGSGKTSLIFSMVEKIQEKNWEELVFMRDVVNGPVQFNRYKKWSVMAEHGLDIRFRDIIHDRFFKLPVTRFKDYKDCYCKAKPEVINAVYFKDERDGWLGFVNFLRRHNSRKDHKYLVPNGRPVWKTVVWDEYEDIVPSNEPNPLWKKIDDFKYEVKNIRKGLVSLLVNSQSKDDVDHRIRNKIMMHCYLKGAKVDKTSPVIPNGVKSLGVGQAKIDWGTHFGRIKFRSFPPSNNVFEVLIFDND